MFNYIYKNIDNSVTKVFLNFYLKKYLLWNFIENVPEIIEIRTFETTICIIDLFFYDFSIFFNIQNFRLLHLFIFMLNLIILL